MDNKLIYNQSTNVSSVSKSKVKEPIDSSFIYRFLKRLIDITFSLLGIIILSPVLIVVSILIKLESKGPIIFKQKRAAKSLKLLLCRFSPYVLRLTVEFQFDN